MDPVWEVSLTPSYRLLPVFWEWGETPRQHRTAASEVPGDFASRKFGTMTMSISVWEAI